MPGLHSGTSGKKPFRFGMRTLASEVYALTAYLLYRNELIGENDVIDAGHTTWRAVVVAID
jgi:hypothetical protein